MKDDTPMWGEQATNVEFAVRRKKSVTWTDPGLGKTRIYLETYNRLTADRDARVCPGQALLAIGNKGSIPAFLNQSPRWCDHINSSDVITTTGRSTGPQRRKRAYKAAATGPKVLHITPQTLKNDFDLIPWDNIAMIAWDECDMIRDHQKGQAQAIQKAFKQVQYGIMGTGTLMPRGPQDIFLYIHICDPKMWGSYWKFVNTYCETVQMPFGRDIIGPKNIAGFQKYIMQKYVFRIDANASTRPPLTREKVMMDMSPLQRRIYSELAEEFLSEVEDELHIEPNVMAVHHKLRQLLISPIILGSSSEWGPSLERLDMVIDEDPHIVVFTPYHTGVDAISAWGESKGLDVMQFTGKIKDGETLAAMEKEFNDNRNGKKFAVATTAFSRGFELWTSKQCHHLGFSYVADQNYQAEKRLSRLITPHPVSSYYYVYRDTVEEDMLEMLNFNKMNVNVTMKDFTNGLRRKLNLGN